MRTCTLYGLKKDPEQFAFRRIATGRRHRRCKSCGAGYARQHYAANQVSYVRRANQRSRALTRSLKEQVWNYLAEHPCVDCGQSNPIVLEFDHVDRQAKRKTIYRLVQQAYSWAAISAEVDRCEVRCANCHRRRTACQFGWARLHFGGQG